MKIKRNLSWLCMLFILLISCEQEDTVPNVNVVPHASFDEEITRSLASYNLRPADFESGDNIRIDHSTPQGRSALIKQKKLTIGNEEIAYFETSGKGPDILLIHGNAQSSNAFSRQLNSVLASTFHIISIDLPGHGLSKHSPNPETTYQIPGLADVLVEVVDALNMEKAVIVGWSLGGTILLEAADRLPKVPGLMILGSPPLRNPFDPNIYLPSLAGELLFKFDITEEEIQLAAPDVFRPGIQHIPEFFYSDVRLQDPWVRFYLGVSVGTGNYKDQVTIVENLSVPLAVVNGREEQIVNLAYQQSLTIPTLWHNKLWEIPHAGHVAQWENPYYFNVLLAAFTIDVNIKR